MPGPAGHNAVVLFFSMNRYISVGGCRKSLPADIPMSSSCICTESYMEAAKTEQEDRLSNTESTRTESETKRDKNLIKKRKGKAVRTMTRGSRAEFCLWFCSYFPCSVTCLWPAFCLADYSRTKSLEQPRLWYIHNKILKMGCLHKVCFDITVLQLTDADDSHISNVNWLLTFTRFTRHTLQI